MIDPMIAYITCACGQQFQVLNEDGTDWDEAKTASAYYAHVATCPACQPPIEE